MNWTDLKAMMMFSHTLDFCWLNIKERYLMAAGFPIGSSIEDYLLPRQDVLLVGSAVTTSEHQGHSKPPLTVTLRQLGPFDPPVVIALPALLRDRSPKIEFEGGPRRPTPDLDHD